MAIRGCVDRGVRLRVDGLDHCVKCSAGLEAHGYDIHVAAVADYEAVTDGSSTRVVPKRVGGFSGGRPDQQDSVGTLDSPGPGRLTAACDEVDPADSV